MVLQMDVYRKLTSLWIKPRERAFKQFKSPVLNVLRRHLYITWLSNNPTCTKCSTEEETSVHILCECEALASPKCEALASLRHTHLGSFFLDPEDIRKLSKGAIWNFAKGTGLL